MSIDFEPNPEQEPGDIRENAQRWIDENPRVMELFRRFAFEMANKHQRFGMKALCERVRWDVAVMANGGEFKINNSHVAYIARDLVRRYPGLTCFLSFRRTKYDMEPTC